MNLQVIKNRIRKIFAYSITSILFLLISSFLILQMPPVQNFLINYFLKDFSKITGFNSSIQSFKMLWFDRLELTGVNIYDPAGNKMIRANEILINFKLTQLLNKQDVNIDGIYLDSAHVYVTKINESDTSRDLNINVLITRINESFSSGKGGSGRTPRVNIGEAFLNQSQFTYNDQDKDSITNGFNYNHFSLAVDEGQLKSFVVIGDTTQFDVRTLIAQDLSTKFSIKQLSTFFRISQQSMEFIGLDLKAGESVIADTVIFNYNRQLDLNDFIHKVKIHANLDNTVIHPKDLAYFAPGVERIEQPLNLHGVFNGRINKFKVTEMDISLGNTRFLGSIDMDGLPNIHETFIILNVKDSKLDPTDLSFIFNDNVLERLRPMGRVDVEGQFLGYPSDFVANGNFKSRLGYIRSDINFKVNEKNIDLSEYSGNLTLNQFQLGAYLNDTSTFQKVTLNGKIIGAGLTSKTADFLLNGKINSIGLRGYNYKNITSNARFAKQLVSGLLEIDDPNLQFKARGTINLREGQNRIQLQAQLDTAYLHKLKLAPEEVFIRTTVKADITGLELDSIQGIADLSDLYIQYKDQSLSLDQIHINAERSEETRAFEFQSNLIDGSIRGNYTFSNLLHDAQILGKEISLNIKNDQREIEQYYKQKQYRPKSYEAVINFTLKDIKPIVQLLKVDLTLSPNTIFEGKFTSGYTTIFNAYSSFDSLTYNGSMLINTEAELTASKIVDSTSVLAMATVTSEKQIFNKNLSTKNLLIESIWNNNHIDFGLDADQDGRSNYVRLKGGVDFLKDSTVIAMAPSTLNLLERNWAFAENNFISIKGSDWNFHQLALQNDEQSITINGSLSNDPARILTMQIDKLNLSVFNVLTIQKFSGVMDAQVDLANYYKRPAFQNSLSIKDLMINDFLVGDVGGKNAWDTTNQKFNINVFIERSGSKMVNIEGDYKPLEKDSPLNLNAQLDRADLKISEPFLKDIFSRIGGTISGDFKITGPLNSPEIEGEGTVDKGQLMVDYLKTMYRFTGKIGLTPTSLYFKDIVLTDAFRNNGFLNGAIVHNGFANMAIDLTADFQNFQVLNTSVKDNSLFYGQAYASGDVNFFGPLSNLRITSTAKTERNTRIYIPIGGSSSVEKKDFITFENFKDTTLTYKIQKDISNKINLTGLTFDLNLDVTPDAYCEIIFDIKAGDIIRGRGNGDLKLQLDTKGEFNMFGPFELTQGWYNFTLYDIINKEFEIQKGSRITWYGDPYEATMEINASYNQLASFAPLLDPDIAEDPPSQLTRKYPTQVLLKLDGPMLTPSINFDIVAKDLPKNVQAKERAVNLDLIFTAFKNKLDEQELKRQVFSLIVLRRFSRPEALDASGSVVNSVSELLSNQLSYWMSQVDQNLEIDVDLGTMDNDAFETFQLRFSYTFLNGRLRVTGDGTYNNTSTQRNTNEPTPSSVAGDWTVDYMLTPDGKLRVKMYSRTNVNPILSSVNNQTAVTTGASLIHTQSFNQIKDLWKSNRSKQKKQQQEYEEMNKEAIKEEESGGE